MQSNPIESHPRRRGSRSWASTPGASGRAVRTLRVAAFTSTGLAALGARIGFPLAVIDATPDPAAHLARLRRDEHACWTMSEDWLFDGKGGEEIDPLAPDYEQVRFDPRWLGGRRLPDGLAIDAGSLMLILPASVGVAAFRADLADALAHRRFERVAARPGRIHGRRLSGRPLHVLPRYSRSGGVGLEATSFRRVEDLYEFRPDQFPDLVASAIVARERALALRTVLGTAAGRRRA